MALIADRRIEAGARMVHSMRIAALCVTFLLSSVGSAPADLYRCVRPDGGIVFTDDESTCPGASSHQSSGALQTHRSQTPTAPAPAPAPAAMQRPPEVPRVDESSAMKKHWQAKKRAKEDELRALEERSDYLSRFVSGCNRGAEVFARDELGINRTASCDDIRAEYAQSIERQEPIREYLDDGLQRECRRAGCLPGWIR
jgi:hypothetical protein